ncbi:MAG: ABC transporter substrate-binding protein [Campylobacterales bacterium]|nr:ABC transporter substrate-binding protein [Campylobacterales bacterium]
MTKIKVALEWFLNPDHLPFIAGIKLKKYREAGLDVEIFEPNEHYDGFEMLKKELVDIHVNEPLHLFEHYFDGIKSLGCFFETRGGVMIKKESIEKLQKNEKIKITTPASNDVTNKIGFEILSRYAKKQGFELDCENVEFIQTDFYHIKNLKSGLYDGAWLCFYNFEGIEADFEGIEYLFIDSFISPYPNFSALELMSTNSVISTKGEAICKFLEITDVMSEYCKNNIEVAKCLFYDYTKQPNSALMDKIIEDTVTRFVKPIKSDGSKWFELYTFLNQLQISNLTKIEYDNIWANHEKV